MALSKKERVKKQLKAVRERQKRDREREEELAMQAGHMETDSDDELELSALSDQQSNHSERQFQ